MDYFNGNETGENLSLQDMIECDIRSDFNEGNIGVGESLGNSNLEPHLSVTVGDQMVSMFDSPIYALGLGDTKSIFNSFEFGNASDLNWIQNVNLSSIPDLCRPENTDPNLMVNPQTGMPNSAQEMSSEMSHNMNESAVREALLRTPDQTTFVTVAPSQIQEQPQYIEQQQIEPPQREPTPPHQPPQPQQSAIRQHLQGQILQQQPQSPIATSPYPHISSPQPMIVNSPVKSQPKTTPIDDSQKVYPKPVYSYSCLIAMALKNCETGCLPVSEIYNFMTENFPYFKTAPDGWKNSVRHNLSLNKCFEKIENPKSTGTTKKGCLWAMNPAKIEKMEEEIAKWRKKDPIAIKRSMAKPEVLDLLEQGHGGRSPMSVTVTTPTTTTPITTTNNNVVTKVSPSSPMVTTIKTEPAPHISKLVTNISANVNVIEIKPVKHEEMGGGSSGAISKEDLAQFTSEELSMLDSNMTLDPALSDLAIQNGLFGAVNGMFDDLDSNDLNLDDLPTGGSPLSFTFSSTGGLTASPIHFSAGASGAANPSIDDKSSLQSSFNLFNCSAATPTSAPGTPTSTYAIARTISAQT